MIQIYNPEADEVANETKAENITITPGLLTVQQAANYLQLSEDLVYRLCHRDDFPVIRVGRKILIYREGLNEWVKSHYGDILYSGKGDTEGKV